MDLSTVTLFVMRRTGDAASLYRNPDKRPHPPCNSGPYPHEIDGPSLKDFAGIRSLDDIYSLSPESMVKLAELFKYDFATLAIYALAENKRLKERNDELELPGVTIH